MIYKTLYDKGNSVMPLFFQETQLKRANMITLALAFTFSIFSAPTSANASPSKTYRIAVYRGDAGCAGCSEMVVKSLVGTGLPLNIAYSVLIYSLTLSVGLILSEALNVA